MIFTRNERLIHQGHFDQSKVGSNCKTFTLNIVLDFLFVQESCTEQIQGWLERFNQLETVGRSVGQSEQKNNKNYGLIIDGQTLQYALEKPLDLEFLELAKRCQVVVCCRAAPVQKVSYV